MKNKVQSHIRSNEELLALEDDWIDREESDDGDERQAWLLEGIELFNELLKSKSANQHDQLRFRTMLADLHLEYGRDEKIRVGNFEQASRYLYEAARLNPEKPQPYYHLAFLMENRERRYGKWEAIAFYAKESLDKGISGDKKIKLLSLLGAAYGQIGFSAQADHCFRQASRLDQSGEYDYFIERYLTRSKKSLNGSARPFIKTGTYEYTTTVSRQNYEEFCDKATEGHCYVLDLTRDTKIFIGKSDSIPLAKKEAEVLAFLIEAKVPCPRGKIEAHVWEDRKVSAHTVKKYINTIRNKISDSSGEPEYGTQLLQTTEQGYVWKAAIETHILRK